MYEYEVQGANINCLHIGTPNLAKGLNNLLLVFKGLSVDQSS